MDRKSKGRWFYVLCFIGVYAIAILVLIIRSRIKLTMDFDAAIMIVIASLPITVPALLIPIYYLFKRKIPKEIRFSENEGIQLIYSSKKHDNIPQVNLAYSLYKYPNYSVLEFYRTVHSSRGHVNYHKVNEVMATIVPVGWRPEMVMEIAKVLEEEKAENREVPDDQNFVVRLFT